MPFMLYGVDTDRDILTYQSLRQVRIGGSSGPIAAYVRSIDNNSSGTHLPWHMPEPILLEQLVEENPDGYAVLIDLKPKAEGNVSLYQIKDIWGYSDPEWTPIALRLDALFIDEEIDDPDGFKQRFTLPVRQPGNVYEFLYLQGGTEGGTWNWGMVGSVNAPLLWPDTLRYFVSEINKTLFDQASRT